MRASSLRRSTALTAAAISTNRGRGRRSNSVKISRTCGTVSAGFFPPQPQPLQLQEPQRQQGERHVVLPPRPTAHLVVVQPHLLVALLEQLLHLVPRPLRSEEH